MENVNWEKYTEGSLDFMVEEGKKLLSETFTAYREITNRSYATFGLITALISFCVNEILSVDTLQTAIPYFTILIFSLLSISFLFKNLIPGDMTNVGSRPSVLIDPYFEEFKEGQIIEYKISKIEACEDGIEMNLHQNNLRYTRFINAVKTLVIGLIFSLLIFLFFDTCRFTKCFFTNVSNLGAL